MGHKQSQVRDGDEQPERKRDRISAKLGIAKVDPTPSSQSKSGLDTTQPEATADHQQPPPTTPAQPPPPPATPQPPQPPPQPPAAVQKPKPMAPTPNNASTVPCQYRTGKTLGSGTYAIVKEAVHIKTGKYYACKVINKKLMEGREHMVRNEISVLKRVSKGHTNVVTLHDYFETTHNLYLVFDLCTGGELFDRICAKGNYYEADAAHLVRTVLKAVQYIHDCGIVHRDLKPENLLFRSKEEEADIMIADFGLSRVMDDEKFQMLTEICGTPGYMAPEIFKKSGHSKPVDIWAMGVITYFLLCGYTPFDRDTQQQEMEAIIAGDYKFEPVEYWQNVSQTARDFVRDCLTIDPTNRPTAAEALQHKWLASETPHFVTDTTGGPKDLLPNIQAQFNAKKTFRRAVLGMMAMNRLSGGANISPAHKSLANKITTFKEDSEREHLDSERQLTYHHGADNSEYSHTEGGHSRAPSAAHLETIRRTEAEDDLAKPNEESIRRLAKMSIDDSDKPQN